jgi:hypothetical protein
MSATTVALFNTTQVIVGTGSPETVVTGAVGDLYMRTDGAGGTTLYIKQSGAGNTGWGAVGAGSAGAPYAFSGQYYSPMVEDGNSGAAKTIDWNAGNEHSLTLNNAAVTLTLSNPVDGGRYVLLLIQDGSGNRVPTFPGSVSWPGGTVPTWSTVAGKIDLVTLIWRATSAKYFAAANVGY